jgi:transcription elongation GreA/GreB family factor
MTDRMTREEIHDATEAGRRLVRALPPAATEAERERRRRFLRELDRQAKAMRLSTIEDQVLAKVASLEELQAEADALSR